MAKVETLFEEVEQRLSDVSRLPVIERRQEARLLDPTVVRLAREFERFQMVGYNKYPEEIERMEDRLTRVRETSLQMAAEEGAMLDPQNADDSDVLINDTDPTAMMVAHTNEKLVGGKLRAMNMLKVANAMRDEINMMEDEVLLQREKMMNIKAQVRRGQSVVHQTKQLVVFFAKAVNDDKIFKGLIVMVAILLLAVLAVALSIKVRKGELLEAKAVQESKAQSEADYSRIDEKYFYNVAKMYFLEGTDEIPAHEIGQKENEDTDVAEDLDMEEEDAAVTEPKTDANASLTSPKDAEDNPGQETLPERPASGTPEPPEETHSFPSDRGDYLPHERRLQPVI